MQKIIKCGSFMFTTLAFTACQKKVPKLPVPIEPKENNVSPLDQRKEAEEALIRNLDSKNFTYSSFVTVKDGSGKYFANYKLYSDDLETFDRAYSKYKNAVLVIKERKSYLNNVNAKSSNEQENSVFKRDMLSMMSEEKEDRNELHLAILSTNVPIDKKQSFKSSLYSKKDFLVVGNIFTEFKGTVYITGKFTVQRECITSESPGKLQLKIFSADSKFIFSESTFYENFLFLAGWKKYDGENKIDIILEKTIHVQGISIFPYYPEMRDSYFEIGVFQGPDTLYSSNG